MKKILLLIVLLVTSCDSIKDGVYRQHNFIMDVKTSVVVKKELDGCVYIYTIKMTDKYPNRTYRIVSLDTFSVGDTLVVNKKCQK